MLFLLPMVTESKQLWLNLPVDKNILDRWGSDKVLCSSQLHPQPLTQTKHRHCARFKFRQALKKKVEVGPFSLFSLNINATVDSIMRDHGMEKDSQCRSESRTDGSAASCSQAEKRPLNNNILINAPLALLCGYWLKQMKRLLRAGKRSNRAGPLLALAEPPFPVCFRCVERVIRGLLQTLRPLRPSWSPLTIKTADAGGPLTGNYHRKSKLTPVATRAVKSVTPSHPNNLFSHI